MMGRRCVLHVGMHKTGSSSIQNALSGHCDDSLYYLDLGQPNHSVPLVSALMPDLQNYPQVKKWNLSNEQADDLKERSINKLYQGLRFSLDKDVIISAEYFSQPGAPAKKNLSRLHDILKEYFDEVRVIAYIRSPKSFMESALQERIKGGDTKITLKSLYPHYRGRLEKFYEQFGGQNVTLVDYEPANFPAGSVVSDFCRRVGVADDFSKTISSNEKMGYEAIALLYSYNFFRSFATPHVSKIFYPRVFLDNLQETSSSSFSLDETVVDEIVAANKEDISWVEEAKGSVFHAASGSKGYDVSSLDELLTFTNKNIEFYEQCKGLPEFDASLPRHDIFENFLTSYEASCFPLRRDDFNTLRNVAEKPLVAFREFSKALYDSGLVSQSKLILDLALSQYPGAKALQDLNSQVCSALNDLGEN
ncbi:hypothetical protein RSO41_04540 [Halomonas sp. I1]|uniref:hypothetical protein n=1 Tax=Halomonas sp. I1 TaxID=393536 RepID=UPI0028E06ED2|nr:hypothetical protein [Halomonas sp. I1]MDT8893915.1 hypothetical protein [Halomonas sp. I1]